MKKTIEQLIAEGKRKRAARLLRSGVTPIWPGIDVLNGWLKHPDLLTTVSITSCVVGEDNAPKRSEPIPIRNAAFGLLQPDGTITNITHVNRFMHKFFEEPPISSIAQRHKEITGNTPTVIRITNNDLRAAARWMRDEEHLDDDDTDAD